MTDVAAVLTIVAAVGAGLVGGVFFAFSTFVMRGLRALPAPTAVAAMQQINVAAPTAPFMTLLFGTMVTAAASVVAGLVGSGDREADVLRLVGFVSYLVVIAVTAAFHVPRNDALARVDAAGADAGPAWRRYAGPWVAGNHVRTAAACVATAVLTIAVR
jgi:uncharacterized membrane protein